MTNLRHTFFAPPSDRLSLATIALHWVVAIGMVGMLLYGSELWLIPSGPAKAALIPLHKSFGIVVGVLALLRACVRIYEGFPTAIPENVADREPLLAYWVHVALLIMTLILPLSGIAKSITYARPVAVFGFNIIPQLLDKKIEFWHSVASLTHNVAAVLLTIFLFVHTGAAIFHHFVRRDAKLRRMCGF